MDDFDDDDIEDVVVVVEYIMNNCFLSNIFVLVYGGSILFDDEVVGDFVSLGVIIFLVNVSIDNV